jgi:hypothetical protein
MSRGKCAKRECRPEDGHPCREGWGAECPNFEGPDPLLDFIDAVEAESPGLAELFRNLDAGGKP